MQYVFSGMSIIAVIYFVILIVYRVLKNNGFKLKKIKINTINEPDDVTRKDCFKVFGSVLLFRIFIIIISILIYSIFINGYSFSFSDVIDNWVKWDANNYLRIAHSYTFYVENEFYPTLVFFPMYPLFISVFKLLFNEVVAGLIVSNLASSIACVYIYKLVSMDYGKKVSVMSLVILNLFPFAFFFSSIMSESVFLLFSAMTLYYARKHQWLMAGFCGLFCSLSRSLGVFIIIPVLVEFIEEYKLIKNIRNVKENTKIILKKGLPLLLILFGMVVYLYCNYRITGDWFYFLKMQSDVWGQVYKPFYLVFDTIYNSINGYNPNFISCISIPQLIIICFSYIVLLFGIRRHRTMYSIWFLVNIIVNTSMSWPLSICRYFTCTIPLFIYIAYYLKNRQKLYIGYIVVNAILYTIYFIAYLMEINIF